MLDEWQRETFASEAEAKGFAYGLTYGDEPQYEVDTIESCAYSPGWTGLGWDVVFRLTEDS